MFHFTCWLRRSERKNCSFSCEILCHKVKNVVFLFNQAKLKSTTLLFFTHFISISQWSKLMRVKEERGEGSRFKIFRIQKSVLFTASFQPLHLELLFTDFSPAATSLISCFSRGMKVVCFGFQSCATSSWWPLSLGRRKEHLLRKQGCLCLGQINKAQEAAVTAYAPWWQWWLNLQWGDKNLWKTVFLIEVPNLDLSAEVNQVDVHW